MIANPNTPATPATKGMYCKVSFTTPDGKHMEHRGRYVTPWAAMQAVEAEVPGAIASAGLALRNPGIRWRKPTAAESAAFAAPDVGGVYASE